MLRNSPLYSFQHKHLLLPYLSTITTSTCKPTEIAQLLVYLYSAQYSAYVPKLQDDMDSSDIVTVATRTSLIYNNLITVICTFQFNENTRGCNYVAIHL